MIRWDCPQGLHPGALGPQRPRKDAVVRFCWPCSLAAGRLVERIAPSIESKRCRKAESLQRAKDRKAEAAQQKAAVKATLETPKPTAEVSSGLGWVREEFDRLRALPFTTSNLGSHRRYAKKRARDNSFGCRLYGPTQPWNHAAISGHHWPDQDRITVTLGPRASRAKVSELLLHELCHAACPTERGAPNKNGKRRRIYHGRTFREYLVRAAHQAYGLDISLTAAGRSAYKLDAFIIAALEARGGDWVLPLETS